MSLVFQGYYSSYSCFCVSIYPCGALSDNDCPCYVISLTSILATYTRNSLRVLYICMHPNWNLYDLRLLKVPLWIPGINRIAIIEAACVQFNL